MILLSLWKGSIHVNAGRIQPLNRVPMKETAKQVADATGVCMEELRAGTSYIVAHARQEAMVLQAKEGFSHMQIGTFWGRDPSTVAHAKRVVAIRAAKQETPDENL